MRYVLEGTWSGYRASQRQPCHLTIITERRAKQLESAGLTHIGFSDGTGLYLRVRQALPRERIYPNDNYGNLIEGCLRHGVSSVEALHKIEDAGKVTNESHDL